MMGHDARVVVHRFASPPYRVVCPERFVTVLSSLCPLLVVVRMNAPRRMNPTNGASGTPAATAAAAALRNPRGGSPPGAGPRWVRMLRSLLLCAVSLAVLYQCLVHFNIVVVIVVGLVLVKVGWLRVPRLFGGHSASGAASSQDLYAEALRRADLNPQPILEKQGESGATLDGGVVYGYSCMQGWRRSMEDAHTTCVGIKAPPGSFFPGAELHFFGVYDGHSGSHTAQFCGASFPKFLTASPSFAMGRFPEALTESFVAIDKHLHADVAKLVPDRSGCTAVTLLITPTSLHCANAGDSRCVLCRDGRAFPLSNDHKPNLPQELRRIQRARGFVWNKRVNGVLALSRAIGDFAFKNNPVVAWEEQAVTCVPEVTSVPIERGRDSFVVVACDGIWDVKTNDDVINFVQSRLQAGHTPEKVAEDLMESCLAPTPLGIGCDNMSVIIIVFASSAASGSPLLPTVSAHSASPVSDGSAP